MKTINLKNIIKEIEKSPVADKKDCLVLLRRLEKKIKKIIYRERRWRKLLTEEIAWEILGED